MSKCINCGKELPKSSTKPSKYCSDACRKAYGRKRTKDNGQIENGQPLKENEQDKYPKGTVKTMNEGVVSLRDKDGKKICNTCFRRIIDIKEQWVNPDEVTEEDANRVDKCLPCVRTA